MDGIDSMKPATVFEFTSECENDVLEERDRTVIGEGDR
jgi:hypothetical protein